MMQASQLSCQTPCIYLFSLAAGTVHHMMVLAVSLGAVVGCHAGAVGLNPIDEVHLVCTR